MGLGAAPLWTEKCSYLTDMVACYAQIIHTNKEIIINRLFSIFFMFSQSSIYLLTFILFMDFFLSYYKGQVWGNLISYLVLKPQEKIDRNGTMKYDKCGADFSEQEYKSANVINEIDQKNSRDKSILILIVFSFLD